MKLTRTAVVLSLLFATAGAAFATDVIVAAATPLQWVSARKLAMQTISANVADMRAKLAAGTIKVIAANARSIASIGVFLPLAYTESYNTVYPVGTSKFFYKGAPLADFQARVQALVGAAEDLIPLADTEDKPAVEAQITKLQGTCGACHGTFRGSN